MKIIFTFAGVFAAVVVAVAALGLYPVARVNGAWLLQRTFDERLSISERVFAHRGVEKEVSQEKARRNLTASVLDSAITEMLLEEFANEAVRETAHAIEQRLQVVESEPDFARRVRDAYGISLREFRVSALRSAALTDMLREAIGQEELEIQMERRRQEAAVSVYILPYRWENGTVIAKRQSYDQGSRE